MPVSPTLDSCPTNTHYPAVPKRAAVSVSNALLPHIKGGHPWIYADAIKMPDLATGTFVNLVDRRGQRIGSALYDRDSPLALRIVGTGRETPGPGLWAARLRAAWDLRQSLFHHADTNCYRLVNGEGDRLPGIIVDRYADDLCLKLDTPAWMPHLGDIVRELVSLAAPRGIYFKGLIGELPSHLTAPVFDASPRVVAGRAPPDPVEVREHGMVLLASLQRGQKTGLFLDQRENRARIRSLSHGRSVLNLFSYNGGFSLAAALGGATQVTSVDCAAAALDDAQAIFVANGLDPAAHVFAAQNVFTFLSESRARFDLVICDPPSFVPRKSARPQGLAAYVKLHRAAIRAVRPQGLLAAASCSSHVDMEAFTETLREAAAREHKNLRLLERRGNPADHPSPLRFEEGRYLKLVLAVVD